MEEPQQEEEKESTPDKETEPEVPINNVSIDSSSEEEESEEEESEDESSEDERERRRQSEANKPKLRGMDPIDQSESDNKPTEFSSDDEEEKSFVQKLGSMLFFGCGNAKDKQEKPKTLQ